MGAPINPLGNRVILPKNQTVPSEGPKAVPLLLDFTGTNGTYSIEGLQFEQLHLLSMIQTVYIDLSGNPNQLTVTVINGGQVIKAKGNTQGYYPILCPNPWKLKFDSAIPTNLVPIFLINIPIAGVVWSTQ